jgi:hypothetical protein
VDGFEGLLPCADTRASRERIACGAGELEDERLRQRAKIVELPASGVGRRELDALEVVGLASTTALADARLSCGSPAPRARPLADEGPRQARERPGG